MNLCPGSRRILVRNNFHPSNRDLALSRLCWIALSFLLLLLLCIKASSEHVRDWSRHRLSNGALAQLGTISNVVNARIFPTLCCPTRDSGGGVQYCVHDAFHICKHGLSHHSPTSALTKLSHTHTPPGSQKGTRSHRAWDHFPSWSRAVAAKPLPPPWADSQTPFLHGSVCRNRHSTREAAGLARAESDHRTCDPLGQHGHVRSQAGSTLPANGCRYVDLLCAGLEMRNERALQVLECWDLGVRVGDGGRRGGSVEMRGRARLLREAVRASLDL
jgi:hypothetical protein